MENVQPTRAGRAAASTSTTGAGVAPAAGGVSIAKALSELDAARETRKRKRGALQDISNNSAVGNKKAPATLGGKPGAHAAAVKKPLAVAASTNAISVVTSTNRLRAVNPTASAASSSSRIPVRASSGSKSGASSSSSSSTSLAPSGKRQSAVALKKIDAITKRRKPEGDENQPHVSHKVQTSMLSFQTSSAASTVSMRSSQNSTTTADTRITDHKSSSAALLKKVCALISVALTTTRR